MNKFEEVSSLGHQMSLAEGGAGGLTVGSYRGGVGLGGLQWDPMGAVGPGAPCTIRPHGQEAGLSPCMVRSNASWAMVTWDLLPCG